MKKKVLFIYRHNELKDIFDKNGKVIGPAEFLFGMNLIKDPDLDIRYINAPRGIRKTFLEKICYLFEKPFSKKTVLGLPFEIYPLYKKHIDEADVLFCENDAVSLGILFWKKLGFIKGKVIVMMQSLPERIKYFRSHKLLISFISSLLNEADLILTLSSFVHKDFIKDFNLDSTKVKTLYFGADTAFWKPERNKHDEPFVLSVGNDSNRDYQTLVEALPEKIALKIVTRKTIETKGKNVQILTNITNEELRSLYNQCLFVVVPSIRLKNESSGLSCTLQAMACGKAVCISACPPIEEIFTDNKECLFYKAEDAADLNGKLSLLYHDQDLRKKLVKNGQLLIRQYSCVSMAKNITHYIKSCL